MLAKGQTIRQLMERFAPKRLAVADDRIGLQLGTLDKEVGRVLVALDVTEAVAEEAIAAGCGLIIAHHAIIYNPLKAIATDTPAGRLYEKLIKHGIAVYIAHTNLDVAEGGVNDMMALALGLSSVDVLAETGSDPLYKLVVYVPDSHLDGVRNALFAAGAGHIGNYNRCGFHAEGTGTFLPAEGTKPFIGRPGELESVRECRLETIVPERVRSAVTAAMKKAHPYEEPAYDLFRLEIGGRPFGLGRIGRLDAPVTLAEMADRVKRAFDVPALRVVGDDDRPVRKIAVLGGSGARYMRHALNRGADVYITGDIDYHTAIDAREAGLALIDPGHNAEKILKEGVAAQLRAGLAECGQPETEVLVSAVNTEPFRYL